MATALSFESSRKIKNTLARWLISFGGISVLFTLVLIFLYLLYVVKPIFDSASVSHQTSITIPTTQPVLAIGIDELKEVAYQIDASGDVTFVNIADNGGSHGNILSTTSLPIDDTISQVVRFDDGKQVILTEQGLALVANIRFVNQYVAGQRTVVPQVEYPVGDKGIAVDEQGVVIEKLAFALNEEKGVFVAFTSDQRLIKTSLLAEDSFEYDSEHELVYQSIDFSGQSVDNILITPDLAMAFVQFEQQINVYGLDDEFSFNLKAQIIPKSSAAITAVALLSGGSSLLIGDANGQVSQWFEVKTEQGWQFKHIRDFQVSEREAVAKVVTEKYRKSFFTLTDSGELGVFYTTSEAELWRQSISAQLPVAMVIAPRSDGLLYHDGQQLHLATVENEHPEVTWSALWQEVWYEGYPEPDYIWQSTSGTDDFEAKFSLVPISFGTIKAALYAMLFALPIALMAAIYTAYFMTPVLRKKVKPTIELMEALPTVILGFLAGLWLAPLIEVYLPAIFLLLIILPLFTLVAAFGWYKLPKRIKVNLPETWAPLLLIPVLMLGAGLSFELSPWIEASFFGGDMRQYISNDLGIDFDQRNALVVGIAMGFAVIPTIFSMAEDAIFSVPKHLTSGSLALGATPWQTLTKVVLLTASPGIFSAVMMGIGRAVGETMIVLMATGNTPILDWNIFEGMRTLSANIAVEMPESEVGSSHYRILFLAAFVLFIFTFVFNTLAEFIRQRLKEKYSSL